LNKVSEESLDELLLGGQARSQFVRCFDVSETTHFGASAEAFALC
jgi:hypothetical protein